MSTRLKASSVLNASGVMLGDVIMVISPKCGGLLDWGVGMVVKVVACQGVGSESAVKECAAGILVGAGLNCG